MAVKFDNGTIIFLTRYKGYLQRGFTELTHGV
ncbi:MAG: hypothetical protein RLZZ507_2376 [Cyanobacteriota bacterium]|jgi:hypothetical protein